MCLIQVKGLGSFLYYILKANFPENATANRKKTHKNYSKYIIPLKKKGKKKTRIPERQKNVMYILQENVVVIGESSM